jgi:hypothetical protein
VLAGAGLLAARDGDGPGRIAAQRAQLVAYEQNLEPIIDQAGEVVARGLRAGVDDIHASRYDDQTLATMTQAWADDLGRLRARLDRLDPPAFLARAHGLYLDSLAAYVGVADRLMAAVAAHQQERIELVLQAAHRGESADAVYDRADALIDSHRRRLGLSVEPPVRSQGVSRP